MPDPADPSRAPPPAAPPAVGPVAPPSRAEEAAAVGISFVEWASARPVQGREVTVADESPPPRALEAAAAAAAAALAEPVVMAEEPPGPAVAASPKPATPPEPPAAAASPAPAAAAPVPAAAAAPVPTDVAVQRADFDDLASAVLDAADVASQAAKAATDAGEDFRSTLAAMMGLRARLARESVLIMGVAGGLMVVALVVFVTLSVRMSSRIEQLDATTRAVGKRAVALDAGLVRLDGLAELPDRISEIELRQGALLKSQVEIQARLERALQQSASAADQLPQQSARQQALSEGLLKQVQAIEGRLQAQTAALQSLNRDLKAVQGSAGELAALRRELQSVAAAARERPPEPVRRTAPAAGAAAVVPATPPVSAMPSAASRAEPAREAVAPGARDGMVVYPRPTRPAPAAEGAKSP